MSSDHLLNLATIHSLLELPTRLLRSMVEREHEAWWRWTKGEWLTAGCPPDRLDRLLDALAHLDTAWVGQRLASFGVSLVTLADRRYPLWLKEIPSPPPLLYVRGDPAVLSTLSLAVVGTRQPTPYGLAVTRTLLEPAVRAGLTVVSGLALGIDGQAHRVSVDQAAPTIAVLGCGVDLIYPWEHRPLAEQILDGGAIISEFPLGAKPERHHFPQRNRIISGLAKAVLLVEAGEKSGALITAKFAVDQNRDVLIVPGPITSPQSIGPLNWLKLGATPVTSADDILRVFNLASAMPVRKTIRPPRDETETAIIAVIGAQPRHIDEIVEQSRLDTSVVAATLSLLEIDGLVRHLGGQTYTLNA